MKKLPLFAASALLLFISCQTAELNTLRGENADLRKARDDSEREVRTRTLETDGLKTELSAAAAALRGRDERNDALAKELADLRKRWDLLSKDYGALKDENLRLMSALDEIRFAQSMLLHKNRDLYELKKYEEPAVKPDGMKSGSEETAEPAKGVSLEMSSGIEKRSVDGRTEYFDSLTNPDIDRGFFLSIEERPEDIVLLRLNIVYSYAAEDEKLRVIGLGLVYEGRTYEVPFAPENVVSYVRAGLRKDSVSLPLSKALAEGLRRIFSDGGEVRVIHVFPEYSRERIVTAAERKSLFNILYAYREMGGSLN